MNLLGIGTAVVDKSNATKTTNSKASKSDGDFFSILNKTTEKNQGVEQKPKDKTAKDTQKDDQTTGQSEQTTKKDDMQNKETKETDTVKNTEEQDDGETAAILVYAGQMAVNPLWMNQNLTANHEQQAVTGAEDEQVISGDAAVASVEAAPQQQQQTGTQTTMEQGQNPLLNQGQGEQQEAEPELELTKTPEQKVTVEVTQQQQTTNTNVENEGAVQIKAGQQQNETPEAATVVHGIGTAGIQEDGQVQIPVSDSSAVLQRQPAEQLADRIVMSMQNGTQEFMMTLNPEKLGQIAVKLIIDNGMASVHVQVQNGAAHSALAGGLAELRSILENNNLQVAEVEISMSSGDEQQEKQPAQQENRQGSRQHIDNLAEEEAAQTEEQVVVGETELDYSI